MAVLANVMSAVVGYCLPKLVLRARARFDDGRLLIQLIVKEREAQRLDGVERPGQEELDSH